MVVIGVKVKFQVKTVDAPHPPPLPLLGERQGDGEIRSAGKRITASAFIINGLKE